MTAPVDNARTRRRARYLHRKHTDHRAARCPLCTAEAEAAAAELNARLRQTPRGVASRRAR